MSIPIGRLAALLLAVLFVVVFWLFASGAQAQPYGSEKGKGKAKGNGPDKVCVLHGDAETGQQKPIYISSRGLNGHLKHGDALAADATVCGVTEEAARSREVAVEGIKGVIENGQELKVGEEELTLEVQGRKAGQALKSLDKETVEVSGDLEVSPRGEGKLKVKTIAKKGGKLKGKR
jgi:hypothetical protein